MHKSMLVFKSSSTKSKLNKNFNKIKNLYKKNNRKNSFKHKKILKINKAGKIKNENYTSKTNLG